MDLSIILATFAILVYYGRIVILRWLHIRAEERESRRKEEAAIIPREKSGRQEDGSYLLYLPEPMIDDISNGKIERFVCAGTSHEFTWLWSAVLAAARGPKTVHVSVFNGKRIVEIKVMSLDFVPDISFIDKAGEPRLVHNFAALPALPVGYSPWSNRMTGLHIPHDLQTQDRFNDQFERIVEEMWSVDAGTIKPSSCAKMQPAQKEIQEPNVPGIARITIQREQ